MFIYALMAWFLAMPVMAMAPIESEIYDIDIDENHKLDTLILLDTGHVIKLPAGNSRILKQIVKNKEKNHLYQFKTDDNRYVTEMKLIEKNNSKSQFPFLFNDSPQDFEYIPTTIASMDVARRYFREARYNPKDSQCFNRAMVWTYEWWKKHSLKSNKLFLFFTRSYIRRYNFEWWFHVAPYVHILDDGKVVEKVMDIKYSRGPIDFKRWTNIFLNKNPDCPVITQFSEYADYPYTGDCFIQRTHMYTYQPADLQMYESWGYFKTYFNLSEVKAAYLEAYDEVINKNLGAIYEK